MFKELPDGRVILDATPVEVPSRLQVAPNRAEQIRRFVREEMSRAAHEEGHETFAEADDFSMDDDEPLTPYELMMLDGEVEKFYNDRVAAVVAARGQSPAPGSSASAASAAPSKTEASAAEVKNAET